MKRKLTSDADSEPAKKLKMTTIAAETSAIPMQAPPAPALAPVPAPSVEPVLQNPNNSEKNKKQGKGKSQKRPETSQMRPNSPHGRVNKLKPPRPFPTVPASVSATGPRSAHREGKNLICITRHTSLGVYMRRCKKLIIEDGYKTLHLSGMGAAIPLLLQLVCALPPILPHSPDDIQWEVKTGTVEVQDEVVPEDDDEDLSYQTRNKSNLSIVFKIGDGEFEGDHGAARRYSAGKTVSNAHKPQRGDQGKQGMKGQGKSTEEIIEVVYEEPEQEFMDTL